MARGMRGLTSIGPPGAENYERQVPFRQTYFRLLAYAKPYLPAVGLILGLSFVTSFIGILPPQVMGVAIDEITGFGESRIERPARDAPSRPSLNLPIAPYIHRAARYVSAEWLVDANPAMATAFVLVAAFLVLFAVARLVSVAQGFIMARVGQSLIYDMRSHVYAHVQRLPLKYFEDRPTGDVMSRVINDVNSLEQVIVGPVVGLITDVSRLLFVFYFCLSWDWKLTLMSLIAAPGLIVSTALIGRLLRKNFRLLREKMGELNAAIQDNITGIRIIQSFVREDYELERFNRKSHETYTINVRLARIFTAFRPWIDFLNQIGILVVLGFGSIKVMNGEMKPGMFVVFIQYLPMLFEPITGFTRFYNMVQQALASCERVFEVLDTEPAITSPPNASLLPRLSAEVEFRGVHFAYRPDVEVLGGIDLHAKPGEMVALVGPSGAGKSTLVNLIPRFYDPTRGGIFVDGHDLRTVDLTSLRKQIGVVLQDPFLFNVSIRENIRYGRLDASDDEVEAAARAANAHDFIVDAPEGYDTLIGERGIKLSGGQRQRLSIARAILADARILILDEATSSVDSETEHLIQEAIHRLVRNRTTFVIAHRLSTVQDADQILVLDGGRIVERGTHGSLLAADGLYARLHEVQFRAGSPSPEPEPRGAPRRQVEPIPTLDNGSNLT
ncbi:ABC transporter ATP-binding protein [Candidatus Poribacteria bacterium]|nr:ABC transporter ATP-binding protein [Candidatus Poribacteria bacterium]